METERATGANPYRRPCHGSEKKDSTPVHKLLHPSLVTLLLQVRIHNHVFPVLHVKNNRYPLNIQPTVFVRTRAIFQPCPMVAPLCPARTSPRPSRPRAPVIDSIVDIRVEVPPAAVVLQ